MRWNWRISMLASVCALALTTAACGDDGSSPGGGDAGDLESTTVRIIAAPPEFDSITDAKWFELLEEAGITVEILEFEFGPDTTRALVSGEGDIASTSPLPVMQYLQEAGGGLKVVAAEILKTDYLLMTTPDITSLDQLEGKKVGISEPGDISDSLTRVMLEEAGVDISTIDFVQIGGTSDRIAALSAGEISAGAAHAADGYAAAEAAGLTPLANYWEYIPVYAQRFIAVGDGWLEENPNLAQLVVDKLLEANQWAVDNKDEYIAMSQEYVEEMSDEIRSDVYDLFLEEGFFAPDGGLEAVDATIEVERAQGTISGDLPDPSEWVIRTLVE
jgi:NitT/TauT family transport system substrate-binding protein